MSLAFGNIPQIAFQGIYLSKSDYIENSSVYSSSALYFSICCSIISVIFAMLMFFMQSCRTFNDCQFAIHLSVDNKKHDAKQLRNKLGKRIVIATAIAQLLDMDADMVVVDRIIHGHQKLIVFITVVGYVGNKNNREECNEERVNHLLSLMNNRKNNGLFSSMFADVLQLDYKPNVYKIADIVLDGKDDIPLDLSKRNSLSQVDIEMEHKEVSIVAKECENLPSVPQVSPTSDGNETERYSSSSGSEGIETQLMWKSSQMQSSDSMPDILQMPKKLKLKQINTNSSVAEISSEFSEHDLVHVVQSILPTNDLRMGILPFVDADISMSVDSDDVEELFEYVVSTENNTTPNDTGNNDGRTHDFALIGLEVEGM